MMVMNDWLERLRYEQSEYRRLHLRYAEDATVGGKLQMLPDPYATRYEGHPQGWNYWVQVRHPPTRQTCEMRDGGMTLHGKYKDAGKIWCRRT